MVRRTYKGKKGWEGHKHTTKTSAEKEAKRLRSGGRSAHVETVAGHHFTVYKTKKSRK